MPYFIYAFSRLGNERIGRRWACHKLERAVAETPLVGKREGSFDG
jgi:hypothetical protein